MKSLREDFASAVTKVQPGSGVKITGGPPPNSSLEKKYQVKTYPFPDEVILKVPPEVLKKVVHDPLSGYVLVLRPRVKPTDFWAIGIEADSQKWPDEWRKWIERGYAPYWIKPYSLVEDFASSISKTKPTTGVGVQGATASKPGSTGPVDTGFQSLIGRIFHLLDTDPWNLPRTGKWKIVRVKPYDGDYYAGGQHWLVTVSEEAGTFSGLPGKDYVIPEKAMQELVQRRGRDVTYQVRTPQDRSHRVWTFTVKVT